MFLSPRETILCHSSDGDVKKDTVLSVSCLPIELLHSGSLKLVLGSWVTSAPRLPLLIQMPQSSWRSTPGLRYYIFLIFIHMCFFAQPLFQSTSFVSRASRPWAHNPLPHTQNLYGATSEPRPSGCITLWASLHNLPADAIWNHSKLSEMFK